MKRTKADLSKPISRQVRRSRQARGPAGRARADLDAVLNAYLEAGHLSASDLEGEISMLRSVLRRVFNLASEESDALEARELALQDGAEVESGRGKGATGGRYGETMRGTPRGTQRGLRKKASEGEHWKQPPLLTIPEMKSSDEEPLLNSFELWVQTLESLSRGALRLANLMRTHQALNAKEPEKNEENQEDAQGKGDRVVGVISDRVGKITTELEKTLEKGKPDV